MSFNGGKSKPYQAKVKRDGMEVNLGSFATAEEAALSCARSPEGRAAAAEPHSPGCRRSLTAAAAGTSSSSSSAAVTPPRAAPAASPVTPRTKRAAPLPSDEDVRSPVTTEEEKAIAEEADGSRSGYSCVVPAPEHAPKPWAAVVPDPKFGGTVTLGYFEHPHTAMVWLLRRLDDPAQHDGSKQAKRTC